MNTDSKVLSLVIPTYNRSNYLDKQISWAVESIKNDWLNIELVVCDNASTDETSEICEEWKNKLGNNITIYRNDENIGLVKNCLAGIERANGAFVWLIGDDDPIEIKLVSDVLDIIDNYPDIRQIHLNHRCVSGIDNSIIIPKFYNVDKDIYSPVNGSSKISELLQKQHTGGFMFITANIIDRKFALSFIKNNPPQDALLLAYPLFLNAGIASLGGFYLFSECKLDCIYHQSSWSDKFENVYYEQVPLTLVELAGKGISKKSLNFCLNYQFEHLSSLKNILRILRSDIKYIKNDDFKKWFAKWVFKNKLKCKMVFQ